MATPRTFIPNDKTSSAYHTQPKTSSAYYTQLNTNQPSDGLATRSDIRPVYNSTTDNGAAATTAPASAFVDAHVTDPTRRLLPADPERFAEGTIPEAVCLRVV